MFDMVRNFTDLVNGIGEFLISALSTIIDFINFMFVNLIELFTIFRDLPSPFNGMCYSVIVLIIALLLFKIVQLIKIW